jgi:hypothetical protein
MINWRQIFSYITEPDLPYGFGRPVVCHSSEYPGKDYAGICLYQGKGVGEEELTYALWSDDATDDEGDFDADLDWAQGNFYVHEEEYLRKVREALALPDEGERHLALSHISGVTWLYTVKCEFLD